MNRMHKIFLKAEWRKLIMINYSVGADLLEPYLPNQTELDLRDGICYISLIGFMFLNTRVKGLKIPFHSDFEEVNLRFYVRYKDESNWRRGTVFIKEIVPKRAISFVANTIYNEHYETLPMKHLIIESEKSHSVEYSWKKKSWNFLKILAGKDLYNIEEGSEEEFICEHYWGFNKTGTYKTFQYYVEHPSWQIYRTLESSVVVDFEDIYGSPFGFLKSQTPTSAFLAEGSEILIKPGQLLEKQDNTATRF